MVPTPGRARPNVFRGAATSQGICLTSTTPSRSCSRFKRSDDGARNVSLTTRAMPSPSPSPSSMPFSGGRKAAALFSSSRRKKEKKRPRATTARNEDSSPAAASPSPPPPSSLYSDLDVIVPGSASPLGPSLVQGTSRESGSGGRGRGGGTAAATWRSKRVGDVNFALWSSSASSVSLCLLDPRTRQPAREIPMARTSDDEGSESYSVWSATVRGLPLKGAGYAFRVDGPAPRNTRSRWSPSTLLLDPYAPLVDSRSRFGVRDARERFVPLVGSSFVGTFDLESEPFDWGDDGGGDGDRKETTTTTRATPPPGKHVIYEVGVRPFTAAGNFEGCSDGGNNKNNGDDEHLRGTFAGLASRAPYLASLGVTAVELLPIFEYDELEFRRRPNPRDHMTNVWGYSHVSFFAPMSRFGGVEVAREVERGQAKAAAGEGEGEGEGAGGGSGGGSRNVGGGGGILGALFNRKDDANDVAENDNPANTFGAVASATSLELKRAVKALHEHGIAVILDVVYNHTAEGDDADPYVLSWRGIDGAAYYQLSPSSSSSPSSENPGGGELLNYSGCGNTVAANSTPARELILASLRHWCREYKVDGFRFDLASALTRDRDGRPLSSPPLIEAIAKDDILSKKILISEPWDCGGLYQVGSFPNWGLWGEWNGQYRDVVRRFLRGDPGLKGAFAAKLAGSADLYGEDKGHNRRDPHRNVNFVIAHDGFSLGDLVSYSHKRNDANGEGGRDGSNDNFSWNCGHEGPTDDGRVLELRAKQARSLMTALFLSQGTPMIVSGDEYLMTHHGNNNWYGHDSLELSHFDWSLAERGAGGFRRFVSGLAELRRNHPALGRTRFLQKDDVTWHEDRWDDPESRFLAFTLRDETASAGDLYAAFNAHGFSVSAHLPAVPSGYKRWRRWVDTNLPSPRDWTPGGNESGVSGAAYEVAPHSAIVLIASRT